MQWKYLLYFILQTTAFLLSTAFLAMTITLGLATTTTITTSTKVLWLRYSCVAKQDTFETRTYANSEKVGFRPNFGKTVVWSKPHFGPTPFYSICHVQICMIKAANFF